MTVRKSPLIACHAETFISVFISSDGPLAVAPLRNIESDLSCPQLLSSALGTGNAADQNGSLQTSWKMASTYDEADDPFAGLS